MCNGLRLDPASAAGTIVLVLVLLSALFSSSCSTNRHAIGYRVSVNVFVLVSTWLYEPFHTRMSVPRPLTRYFIFLGKTLYMYLYTNNKALEDTRMPSLENWDGGLKILLRLPTLPTHLSAPNYIQTTRNSLKAYKSTIYRCTLCIYVWYIM